MKVVTGKVLCCCQQPENIFVWNVRSNLSSDFRLNIDVDATFNFTWAFPMQISCFGSKIHSTLNRKLRFQVLKWQSSLWKEGNLGFSSKGRPTLSRKLRFQVLKWGEATICIADEEKFGLQFKKSPNSQQKTLLPGFVMSWSVNPYSSCRNVWASIQMIAPGLSKLDSECQNPNGIPVECT